MAWTHERDYTGNSTKTSGTNNFEVTVPTGGTPAGRIIIAHFGYDNLSSTTPSISSIQKPGGETNNWQLIDRQRSASTSAGAAVWHETWGIITSVTWAAGPYLVTLSSAVAAKSAIAREWSGGSLAKRSTSGAVGVNGTAVSIPTSGTAPQTGDLVLAAISYEDNAAWSADTDTLNGSWSAQLTAGTTGGGGATNCGTTCQYKIVTGSGHQTFDSTGFNDAAAVIIALQPGVSDVTGTLSGSTPAPTASISGAVEVAGTLGGSTPAPTASIAGTVSEPPSGTLSGTTPSPTASVSGVVEVSGTVAGSTPTPTSSMAGVVDVAGTLGGTTPTPTASVAGDVMAAGTLAGSTPSPTASLSGGVESAGTLAGQTPAPTADITGQVESDDITGSLAGVTPLPTGSVAGSVSIDAALSGVTPSPTASLAGETQVSGALGGSAPMPSAELTGETQVTGILSGTTPVPSAGIAGQVDTDVTGTLDGQTSLPTAGITGTSEATTPTLGAVMRYAALNHFVIVTGLGEAVRLELLDTTGGAPERVCHAVPGAIAWDACECGQLAVSSGRLYPSRNFPASAADDPQISNCGVSYVVVDVVISMTRCVSVPNDDGTAPSCVDLSAETLIMYEDGEAVLKGTMCKLRELVDSYTIADWTLGDLTYQGPEGACAGVELAVKIGFTGICCG